MAVLIDLRDGAGLTQSDKGYRATRIAEVDSLEGSTPSALLLDAMVAVGVPSMGDAHPDITNIKVVEKRTRDTGCTDGNYWAKIEIVYAASSSSLTFETQEPDDDGAAVKAIRGSLVGITVTRDRTGALIKAAKPGTLLDAFEPAERTLPVNKLTPVFILTDRKSVV